MKSRLAVLVGVASFTALGAPLRVELPIGTGPVTHRIQGPGPASYFVDNTLGNIRIHRVPGTEIVVETDGLRYSESAKLRVWEPEPGKIIIAIVYEPIRIQPPAGDVAAHYSKAAPENGVVIRNGCLVLGGRSYTHGFGLLNVGSAGVFTVNGIKGETHISVGLPFDIGSLSVHSGVGDIEIESLGPNPTRAPRYVRTGVGVGTATVHDLAAEGLYPGEEDDYVVTKADRKTIYQRAKRPVPQLVVTGDCAKVVVDASSPSPDPFLFADAKWQ